MNRRKIDAFYKRYINENNPAHAINGNKERNKDDILYIKKFQAIK